MKEPFGRTEALKLIQAIRVHGSVVFTGHAKDELLKDEMSAMDAVNVLRCGKIRGEAELVNGTYRYRVQTNSMVVVVAFRSSAELVVVTAWRKKR